MINTLLSGIKSVGFDKSSSCAAERLQEILLFVRIGYLIVQLCVSGIFVNINYLNADFSEKKKKAEFKRIRYNLNLEYKYKNKY